MTFSVMSYCLQAIFKFAIATWARANLKLFELFGKVPFASNTKLSGERNQIVYSVIFTITLEI